MKKLISLLMTVFVLASVLSVGALADTVPAGAYVTDSIGTELTDGDTIATVEGQLTVVFDSAVTDAALDGISITATVGSFRGAVAAEIDKADSSKVNVRFGRLEDGAEYVLSVPAADFEFNFAAETKYHTNADFEDYTDSNLAENLKRDNLSLIYPSYAEAGGTAYARVNSFASGETSGKKYIGLVPTHGTGFVANKWLGMVVDGKNFNNTDDISEDKVYVLDVAYNRSADVAIGFGALADGTDRLKKNASSLLVSQGKAYSNNIGNATALALDKTLYWPRMVLVRDGSDLRQDLYDMSANATKPYIGSNKNKVSSSTEVKQLTVLSFNSYKATDAREMQIASVKCYPERLLTVIKASPYEGGETRQLVLHMSDEFDEQSVSSDTIVITKVNGGEVTGYDISADNYERTITLTFPDGLRKGDYTIETDGMIGSNGLTGYSEKLGFTVDVANGIEYYETENYSVTDALGTPVSDNNIAGIAKVNVSFDVISDEGNAFTAALVIYNKDGRVVRIATDNAAIANGNESVTLSVSTPDDINIGEDYSVRPLVWLDDIDAGAIFIEEFDKLTALSAQ